MGRAGIEPATLRLRDGLGTCGPLWLLVVSCLSSTICGHFRILDLLLPAGVRLPTHCPLVDGDQLIQEVR
jgi:hypothetical protein